ncbi:ABC transporter ATP-binding protein, partial [bacterium]|nr:ABC transporter ATP-binding protein [bacterium]
MSIKLTKLQKHYGTNVVVNNVSTEIKDGELFVLLGASGSGKSTILRIIAGLTFPDSGSVEVSGKDITFLRPQDRGIGFVFQNYSLFQHLNVYKNVEFGLRIKKISKKECRIRSEELLDIVGLTGFGNRYPKQLSGGQQQRVAVARALASQPAVLLLDEPFGALDVKIRARMRTRLKEIQHRLNVTMILVTHDQEEAFELADRIGIVDRGHLLEVGTPETLYHRPRNAFVATFVGGGNVLIGKTINGQIQLGKHSFPFPTNTPYHEEGVPVRILFRPETVLVSDHPLKPSENLYILGKGNITDILFSGSQTKLMVKTGELIGVRPLAPRPTFDQAHTKIEIIKQGIIKKEGLKIGQEVWLGIKEFHVLDPGGIKLLIIIDNLQLGEILLDFANIIVQKALTPATIFGIVENSKNINQFHEQLASITEKYLQGKHSDKMHLMVGTNYDDI